MSNVEMTGNLTRDPILRYTKNGTAVAAFGIAVNRRYIDRNGQEQNLADFINVAAWDKLAQAVGECLKKGDRVHVSGRLSSRSYDDKDGKKVYVTEVVASEISVPIRIASESKSSSSSGSGSGWGNSGSGWSNGGNGWGNSGSGSGWNNGSKNVSQAAGGASSFSRFGKPMTKEEDIPF